MQGHRDHREIFAGLSCPAATALCLHRGVMHSHFPALVPSLFWALTTLCIWPALHRNPAFVLVTTTHTPGTGMNWDVSTMSGFVIAVVANYLVQEKGQCVLWMCEFPSYNGIKLSEHCTCSNMMNIYFGVCSSGILKHFAHFSSPPCAHLALPMHLKLLFKPTLYAESGVT